MRAMNPTSLPRRRRGHRVGRRAFTLIELLVVIGIIVILTALVIGSLNRVSASQRRMETMSRLKILGQALRIYRDDWGDAPPYNPRGEDFDGDGNPDPVGTGLYALYMLDYVSSYRFLSDPHGEVDIPWIDNGGSRMFVVPGDTTSMGLVLTNVVGDATYSPGNALTAQQQYAVYQVMADPAYHAVPASYSDYGAFRAYNPQTYENFASWMMQDAYTGEWKYLPVRATTPPGAAEPPPPTGFPVNDPTAPDFYHRQLSHEWTDQDSPRYLPASDTVVTWSSLSRESLRRRQTLGLTLTPPADAWENRWGADLVLFADGHVTQLPGPADAADYPASWQQQRAVQRPLPLTP